jgi:glutathione synthase
MRILIILDPVEKIVTYKDSTFAMMVEADRRGHQVFVCGQHELSLAGGRAMVQARPLELLDPTGKSKAWYALGESALEPVASFGATLMRKDPPFDMEYVYSTYLLEHAAREGAKVFNDPRAIRDHNEKFSIAEFPQFTAPMLVTRSADMLREFVAEQGVAVFKLLDGMGGASIFRAERDDPNLSVIIETLNQFGARSVMAQRFLPEIAEGDKRVLLIGGKVVPHCLARIPKQGEFRGNLAAGGRGVARPVSAKDREIGEAVAKVLAPRGLLLIGLDLIGESITEINVTSPTCFQEIRDQTGFDVAAMFIDALEEAAGAR